MEKDYNEDQSALARPPPYEVVSSGSGNTINNANFVAPSNHDETQDTMLVTDASQIKTLLDHARKVIVDMREHISIMDQIGVFCYLAW